MNGMARCGLHTVLLVSLKGSTGFWVFCLFVVFFYVEKSQLVKMFKPIITFLNNCEGIKY